MIVKIPAEWYAVQCSGCFGLSQPSETHQLASDWHKQLASQGWLIHPNNLNGVFCPSCARKAT